MPSHLTLHIGTPKSGTTYLQAILAAGRGPLAADGLLYPGRDYLPHGGFNQQPAVYAVGSRHIRWVSQDARDNAVRYFGRLREEVLAYPGRVMVSAESLAFFDPAEILRFLIALRAEPGRTSVVIIGRDLGRVLPSIWQQNVKNGSVEPLNDYLESVVDLRGREDVPLWTAFGLPGLTRRWAEAVGAENVTLVTAPHRGQDLLWQRFASAAQLPESLPEETGSGSRADRNMSLTLVQADLLRRLNVALRDGDYTPRGERLLRERLLRAWMSAGQRHRAPIRVPEPLQAVVRQWAAEDNKALRGSGVRVVGSLGDLVPEPESSSPSTDPDASDLDEVARDLLVLLEHREPVPPRPVSFPGAVRRAATRLIPRRPHLPRPRRRVVDLSGPSSDDTTSELPALDLASGPGTAGRGTARAGAIPATPDAG